MALLMTSSLAPSPPLPFQIAPSQSSLLLFRPSLSFPSPPSLRSTTPGARVIAAVATKEANLEAATGGGGGSGGVGPGGGGGGGGGGKGGSGGEPQGGGEEEEGEKKMEGLSMSQKLTLGYAALVGVGGAMGYMKSGSQKSLAAGGISALALYFVHTQLPVRPVFASSIGIGISAALLAVMGSRFKKSGKIFPAGVVSLVSLVMAGGYLHGILRSLHA